MTMTKMPKLGAVRKYANGGFIDPTQHATQDQIRATIGRPMANTLGTNSDADVAAFQSRLNTPAQPSVSYTNVNTPNNSIQKVVSNTPSPLDRPNLGQPRQTSFSNVDVQGYQQKPLGAQNAVADDISNNLLNSAIDEAGTLWGFKDGGEIKGPGTGTSDSIPAALPEGAFIIPAAVVRHYGVAKFDKMNGVDSQLPAGQTIPAMVSNGEYQLSPDAVRRIGTDTLNKLIASVPKEQGAETKIVNGVVHAAGKWGDDPNLERQLLTAKGNLQPPTHGWGNTDPGAVNRPPPAGYGRSVTSDLTPLGTEKVIHPAIQGRTPTGYAKPIPQSITGDLTPLGTDKIIPANLNRPVDKFPVTVEGEGVRSVPRYTTDTIPSERYRSNFPADTVSNRSSEMKASGIPNNPIPEGQNIAQINKGLATIPGESVRNPNARSFGDTMAGKYAKPKVAPAFDVGKMSRGSVGKVATWADDAAAVTGKQLVSGVGKGIGKVLSAASPIGDILMTASTIAEPSAADQVFRAKAARGDKDAQRILDSGGFNPIANKFKQPISDGLDYLGDQFDKHILNPILNPNAISKDMTYDVAEEIASQRQKIPESPMVTSLSDARVGYSDRTGTGTQAQASPNPASAKPEPLTQSNKKTLDQNSLSGDGYSISVKPGSGKTRIMEEDQNVSRSGEPIATIGGQKVYMKTGVPVAENDLPMLRSRRESTPESRAELGRTITRNADKGFQERMAQQAAIVDERRAKSQAWDDREAQANQTAQEQAYIDNLRATIAAPTVEHDLFGAQRQRREKANALALLGQINDSQMAKAKLGMDSSQFATKLAQDNSRMGMEERQFQTKLGMDSSQFAAKLAQDKESTSATREANALEKQYQRDQKQSELAKDTHRYTLPNGESFDGTESQFEEAKQLLNDDQTVQKWKDANSKNWGEDDSAYEDRARKAALSKQEIRYDKAGNAFVKDKNGKVIPYKVG